VSDTPPPTGLDEHLDDSVGDILDEAAPEATAEFNDGIEPPDLPSPWLLDEAAGATIDPPDTASVDVLVGDGTNGQKPEPTFEARRLEVIAEALADPLVGSGTKTILLGGAAPATDSEQPIVPGRSETSNRSPLDRLRDDTLWGSAISSLPPLEWLADGLLYRDTVAVIFGPSGTAKSLVAQDIGQCVAAACPWQGHTVHSGKVLYVVAEGTSGIRQRHEAWREHHHIAGEVGIGWIPFPVNLMQPDWVEGLLAFAAEVGAVLIVFDTLARSMAGGDENSTKDMSAVVAAVDRVRRGCRATVLFVHHSGVVGGRQRGSTVLLAAADTELEVVPTTVPGHIALKVTKQRDGATGAKFPLRLEEVGSGRVVVADDQPPPDAAAGPMALSKAQRTALDSLVAFHDGRPMAAEAWCVASGLARTTFYRVLKDLVSHGEVESVEGNRSRPGGYRRVDNGPPPVEVSMWE
jgi:hypothetical protein